MDTCHIAKSCVLILLVVLLCAERAQGLECYNCIGVPPETSCNTTTCPFSDGFCVALEIEVIVDSHRSKVKSNLCLPICPTTLDNTEITGNAVNVKTYCCKEDLCNAAVPTGGSSWTMAGVLLFSLVSVLLQTFL
ncbi:lymphocyte antigen 6G precursor [Mus musculus]|uniref:Lymphocyte antigen 6G n=2 Tax=Mus musculus TaxID=10090 RepID=LY6G_MOUSE|nr:lymphocyte antigen 6G precursor [Mus musculus]NP_001361159.1 lymphocyte antigen 6G precursor [Mus musculus]P35461.2 RecName: Full=Lymphocyte antigen 6G; Short=Ly-6G; AltName: Full=Ly-6G.1; Flags: Precursor [Mus musculus]|eukprot:NP_001297367.1 lymphocyte antigen 6G precursor [Mus musculus]